MCLVGEGSSIVASQMADSQYFLHLLSQYERQIFGFIFAMVQNTSDAEDVFQQASLVMWQKFDQFQPDTDFLAWARTVARYKVLDFLKAKRRDRICFSEALVAQLDDRHRKRTDVHKDRTEALVSCKKKLSVTDQQLLALCYDRSGSIADAAKQLRRPVGSVYDSLSRVRRTLLACIQRFVAREDGHGT